MKYINVFATAEDLASAKANLAKPQLAYVSADGTVLSMADGGTPGPTTGYPLKYKVNNSQPYDFSVMEEAIKQMGCTDINHFIGIDKTEGPDSSRYYTAYFENPVTLLGAIMTSETKIDKCGPMFGGTQSTPFTEIIIPNTTIDIGLETFVNCNNLINIIIPNQVASIGSNAFEGCSGLTSITSLNTTPPTIGYNAFYNVPTTCPIYVPAESVDAYKAADGWSERADYITAIVE